MNRRNFILGLGTAATLSGAASVTGASISGSADAGANFNVIATNNLTIRRNSDLPTVGSQIDNSTENYVNDTVSYVNSEGTINDTIGSGIENVSTPQLTVNDQENDGLSMALGTPNDATVEDNQNSTVGSNASPYSDTNGIPPLEIANNGGQNKTISARYSYGDDVTDTSNNLDESDVNQLITFSVNEGTDTNTSGGKVSPDPSEGALGTGDNANNTVTINSGETATVDLTLNYNSALEEALASAASGGSDYDFQNDGFANVDLLTSVTFGEVQ
ncbi:hypothetical protein [Halonotius sp. GCM10025705]|uniref:hypothetical protein n=1 Tax=Halonotius sp. GCM10025705 TaxID=3252678 RepID=UPI0036156C58